MTAHKFQEKYTGCQMFIWHCNSEEQAKSQFQGVIITPENWIFLGTVDI